MAPSSSILSQFGPAFDRERSPREAAARNFSGSPLSPLPLFFRLSFPHPFRAEMKDRRETVVARLKQLQSECSPILRLIENATLVKQLRTISLTLSSFPSLL